MSHAWPVAVAQGWHPLARLHELDRPVARTLMDVPVVVFRAGDRVSALVDVCPHRNVPLSRGKVCGQHLVCAYHGWRFDAGGRCVEVPGAGEVPPVGARALAVQVVAGLVWVSLAQQPPPFPRLPPELDDASLDGFWWSLPASKARLLDAIENLLDPAHPHFLHPYLVRRPDARQPVDVHFRCDATGGEARYIESATASAWLPRLFEGRRTTSIGRYLAPTTAQLEFRSGDAFTLSITVVFVPQGQDQTRPFAHFATSRGLLPAWFKRMALIGFHMPVLRQDRQALALQAEHIARLGRPDYHHGPMDLFGPLIWRLANGQTVPAEERTFQFRL